MSGGVVEPVSPGTVPQFTSSPRPFRGGESPRKRGPASPGQTTGASGSPDGSEYEFTEKQEKVFSNLAGMMQQTSALFFGMFVVTCMEVLYKHHRADKGARPTELADQATAHRSAAAAAAAAGIAGQAAESFVKVTTTIGSDITLLMNALNELFLLFKRMRCLACSDPQQLHSARFVSAIYVLKTCAMIALETPKIKMLFKSPKTNVKSPLDMTATQATGVIVVAGVVLTLVGLVGIRLDKKKLDWGK